MRTTLRLRTISSLLFPGLLALGLAATAALAAPPCPDADADTFADCTVPGCDPTGLTCGDCDDDDSTRHPGATETCNHRDDDCDIVDEGFAQVVSPVAFHDPDWNGNFFSRSVTGLDDIDGDGVADFVVGNVADSTTGSWAGAVLLYSGAGRTLICRAVNDSGGAGSQLGIHVAAAGDLDGDGITDFAGSAHLSDAVAYDAGEVIAFSGNPLDGCAVIRHYTDPAAAAYDHLGEENALAGLADLTGDGTPELIAGAPLADVDGHPDAGKAIVFDGADGSVVFTLTDPEPASYDQFGAAVIGLADMDSDGTPDIAVGNARDDAGASDGGSVVLFSGADGSVITRLVDPDARTSDWLGWALAAPGDLDLDGTPEVVAAARNRSVLGVGEAGEVVVFSGADGGVLFRASHPAPAFRDYLGWSVVPVPDTDGDGITDLLVGQPYGDPGGVTDAGRALLFSGTDGSLLRSLVNPDAAQADLLGMQLASVGDLSDDGAADYLVGCPNDDIPKHGADRGSLLLFIVESDCDEDGLGPSGGDCDDFDAQVAPGLDEACDQKDNDCDLAIDEDEDGDHHDACEEANGCPVAPGANLDPSIHPGADELCNGRDDDCDGSVDEGDDLDGDTHQTPCDCDDGDVDVHPGQTESCNHRADGCGAVDEGFARLTTSRELRDRLAIHDDRFGASAASIGDVDMDGIPDLAVGAPYDDSVAWDAGQVTILSGAWMAALCRTAIRDAPRLGETLAATGDVDGDGVPDLAAGAPGADAIVLISGADCREIGRCEEPTAAGTYLGSDHGLAGWIDLDGDGVREIVAGASVASTIVHHGGMAFVFRYSRSTGECTVLHELIDPDLAAYDNAGFSVGGVGDLTADGTPDLLVGEPGDDSLTDSNGAVLVFSGADGAFVRRLLDSSGAWRDGLGSSVAGLDDLDGDGWPEVAAGVQYRNTSGGGDAGCVVILSGRDGSVVRRIEDPDGAANDRLGFSIAAVGDVDGDGARDILAGAFYATVDGTSQRGRAVLFSSADGTKIATFEDPAGQTGDWFGYAVADAADLSGDGVPELLVATPYKDGAAGVDTGTAFVFALETDCDADTVTPFGGDCDDADSNVWRVPTEARDLLLAGDKQTLTWFEPLDSGQASGTLLYDTLRSVDPADFSTGVCLETDGTDRESVDALAPAPGNAFCYLVRAGNGCGEGDLGPWGAEGYPRSAAACP